MKRTMPFGKHGGSSIKDVDTGYLKWMLANCTNLDDDLLEAVQHELHARGLQAQYQVVKREKARLRKERSLKGQLATMDEKNRMCAQIILGNPTLYPGLMTEWAGAFMARGIKRRSDPHWEARRAVAFGVA